MMDVAYNKACQHQEKDPDRPADSPSPSCPPALLLATSPWAGAQALNLRPGGWDMTMSLATNGSAPKVSPFKTCVTNEDLERGRTFQKDEDCTYTTSARTPTRTAGTASCKNDQGQTRGDFEIVAASPETVVVKIASSSSSTKGGAVETRMELKGRWASASCQGYDD
jgi:hypothetical protein